MNAFQESFFVRLEEGEANGGDFGVVPDGMIAVIEHVTVTATGTGAGTADYFITSTIGGPGAFREVPVITAPGATGVTVLGSHSFRAFGGPGSQFGGVIRRFNLAGTVDASFVLAGYYTPV